MFNSSDFNVLRDFYSLSNVNINVIVYKNIYCFNQVQRGCLE